DRLRVLEHEVQLQCPQHVLVENGSLVVDPDRLGLFLEAADRLERLAEALLVAEDGDVLVHDLAELGLDLRDAAALLRAIDDLANPALLFLDDRPRDVRLRDTARDLRGLNAGAAA